MENKYIRYSLIAGLLVVVLVVSFAVVKQPGEQASTNNTFNLQAPQFVGVALAEGDSITSFMEDEAGISSYFKASTSITLNDVRDAFRTIEVETTNYIIGSVPVTNYPESEDVHVYVHTNGWVVAYYLASDPLGKIFDWRIYHDTGRTAITTKLENTLFLMAAEAGGVFQGGTYYDFRHPNSTKLMLIADWVYGTTDSFEVKIPSSFVFSERSWSLGSEYLGGAVYELNGTVIYDEYGPAYDWGTTQGNFSPLELMPDQFHTISVTEAGNGVWYVYGGLALEYRE